MKFYIFFFSLYIFSVTALSLVLSGQPEAAPHLITFFIERSLEPQDLAGQSHISHEDADNEIIQRIQEPGHVNRLIMYHSLKRRTVHGIYATYFGWFAYSDLNGQIVFPRKHDKPSVTLIVTRSIQPVLIDNALIHHFIVEKQEPVGYYTFDLSADKKTKKPSQHYFWDVKRGTMPQNRIIPADAIVLFAHPKDIFIVEGRHLTTKGPHLVLPTIYARPSLAVGVNALHFIKINRYFSPVNYVWRFAKARYAFITVA